MYPSTWATICRRINSYIAGDAQVDPNEFDEVSAEDVSLISEYVNEQVRNIDTPEIQQVMRGRDSTKVFEVVLKENPQVAFLVLAFLMTKDIAPLVKFIQASPEWVATRPSNQWPINLHRAISDLERPMFNHFLPTEMESRWRSEVRYWDDRLEYLRRQRIPQRGPFIPIDHSIDVSDGRD